MHQNLGVPPKRFSSREPPLLCDRHGPHCTSDQTKWSWTFSRACWFAFTVVDHAVETCSRWRLTVQQYTVFSALSLASLMGFANLQRVVRLRLVCLLSMRHQDMFLPHSLLWSSTKSDGPVFFLWGQGEQGGGGLGLVNCNVPFLSPAVERVSLQLQPVCGFSFYSSMDHITNASARNAALMRLGSSDSRSLTKSRNNVGDRTPPCGTQYLNRIVVP